MGLKENYQPKNGFIVVKLQEESETLKNGIKIQDTRGKRDIVCGTCLLVEEKYKVPANALVWFPIYAASQIKLNGQTYLILPFEDVMLIEKVD